MKAKDFKGQMYNEGRKIEEHGKILLNKINALS